MTVPLPNTHVIGPGWSAHHQPTAKATMTATVTITRVPQGPGTLDTSTGVVTRTATTVASGVPCRVQQLNTARRQHVAEQLITHRDYQVSVPSGTPRARIGDQVLFASPVDDYLNGRTMTVVDVTTGSETWQDDLVCRDDLTT